MIFYQVCVVLPLFRPNLVRNSETLAATFAAGCQYAAAIGGAHALTKSMFISAAAVGWLECPFHWEMRLINSI
jgi:hypothetical protein